VGNPKPGPGNSVRSPERSRSVIFQYKEDGQLSSSAQTVAGDVEVGLINCTVSINLSPLISSEPDNELPSGGLILRSCVLHYHGKDRESLGSPRPVAGSMASSTTATGEKMFTLKGYSE
jgi:hypothetical protein